MAFVNKDTTHMTTTKEPGEKAERTPAELGALLTTLAENMTPQARKQQIEFLREQVWRSVREIDPLEAITALEKAEAAAETAKKRVAR
jgi:hypothetical protein